jgi:hypothetical protein
MSEMSEEYARHKTACHKQDTIYRGSKDFEAECSTRDLPSSGIHALRGCQGKKWTDIRHLYSLHNAARTQGLACSLVPLQLGSYAYETLRQE